MHYIRRAGLRREASNCRKSDVGEVLRQKARVENRFRWACQVLRMRARFSRKIRNQKTKKEQMAKSDKEIDRSARVDS